MHSRPPPDGRCDSRSRIPRTAWPGPWPPPIRQAEAARNAEILRSMTVPDTELERDARHTRLGYRPALDGLRALAIVMVVCHHSMPFFRGNDRFPTGGLLGVDVFFVLSGFLITTLLLEERRDTGSISLRAFYKRRALRLFPALWVLLAVHAAVAHQAGWDMTTEWHTILAALTYTTNWAPVFHWNLNADQVFLWSLAVEEQFYLVWPFVLRRLLRVSKKAVVWTCLG